MSFKRKIFVFFRGFLKDAGVGLALLGAGAITFQSLAEVSVIAFGVLFIVLGSAMNLASLILMLLEDVIFDSENVDNDQGTH